MARRLAFIVLAAAVAAVPAAPALGATTQLHGKTSQGRPMTV